MGSTLEITVRAETHLEPEVQERLSAAFALAHAWASKLSHFEAESELSRFNDLALGPVSVQCDFENLLTTAVSLNRRFPRAFLLEPARHGPAHGASFEARAPAIRNHDRGFEWNQAEQVFNKIRRTDVDLGGIAKGSIVDRVFDHLLHALPLGVEVTVNAGGDIRTNAQLDVELRIPSSVAQDARYELRLPGLAVATSSLQGSLLVVGRGAATYTENFQAAGRAASVSVVAETCLFADAFTKIAFQHDLGHELTGAEAVSFGLRAVLSFDTAGKLMDATEW